MLGNRWHALVPAKRLDEAKSRLGRHDLTLPFLSDVVFALQGSKHIDQVSVISSDPDIRKHMTDLGCSVISEPNSGGLSAAIATGLQWCDDREIAHVLVALGDLPCLNAAHVDEFLTAGSSNAASFLADAEGTGSTLWMRTTRTAPAPRFGFRSRAAHRESGAYEIEGSNFSGARRDVDTQVNLWDAIRIGVGLQTNRALSEHPRAQLVTISGIDPLVAVDESGRTHLLSEIHRAEIPRPSIGQRLVIN